MGEKKEVEVAQEDFIRMLKLEQDQKILELRQEFDRKARDMQQKYELRMKTIRDDMEKTRGDEIKKIEEQKNDHKNKVMLKNQKDFNDIKVYYSDITTSNLDLIKRLKEEHHDIKKRENADAKHMFDLEQKNRQLKEPLKRAHADVERLTLELQAYAEDKKILAAVKEKIKHSETMLKRMEFQHEVLQQQLTTVSGERDEFMGSFSTRFTMC